MENVTIPNQQENCPNCETVYSAEAKFCHHCGQEKRIGNQRIKDLFLEVLDIVFNFDTKFWKTAKTLIFQPGTAPREFCEEKRIRYLPPMRAYIFSSFLFFLVLSYSIEHHKSGNEIHSALEFVQDTTKDKDGFNIQFGSEIISFDPGELSKVDFESDGKNSLDSLLHRKGLGKSSFLEYSFVKGFIILKYQKSSKKQFINFIFQNLSASMFLIMPVFAFLMFLFNRKNRKNYYEYLIFSIYFHAVCFVILTIFLLISFYFPNTEIERWSWILPAYLFIAMKRCYQQNWFVTFLKWFLIVFSYLVVLCFAMLGLILESVRNLS